MAQDQLSEIFVVQIFSQRLTTNHEHADFFLHGTCNPEAETGSSEENSFSECLAPN